MPSRDLDSRALEGLQGGPTTFAGLFLKTPLGLLVTIGAIALVVAMIIGASTTPVPHPLLFPGIN